MDLRHLRHLVAVADHGSLLGAARSMKLTPAAITKSVQRLEARLRTPLLDRRTRPVRLNDAGRKVVERARQALAVLRALPNDLAQHGRAVEGRVRVGVGPLVAESLLAPVVTEVMRRAPKVSVTAGLGHWIDGTDALKLGEADLFVGDVTESLADPALSARAFAREPIVMICRAGHPILRERSISAADVLRHPLVGNTPPPWGVRWLQDLHRRARRPVPDPAHLLHVVCESTPAVRSILASTDALGFSSRGAADREVRMGRFAVVPFDMGELRSHAGTVVVAGRELSRATELLREVFHLVADARSTNSSTAP